MIRIIRLAPFPETLWADAQNTTGAAIKIMSAVIKHTEINVAPRGDSFGEFLGVFQNQGLVPFEPVRIPLDRITAVGKLATFIDNLWKTGVNLFFDLMLFQVFGNLGFVFNQPITFIALKNLHFRHIYLPFLGFLLFIPFSIPMPPSVVRAKAGSISIQCSNRPGLDFYRLDGRPQPAEIHLKPAAAEVIEDPAENPRYTVIDVFDSDHRSPLDFS
jgi:hypothetical protein